MPHIIDGKEIILTPHQKLINREIVIHGLPEEISQTTLRNFYSRFGEIAKCTIKQNEANESRGFAFIAFNSEESVSRALNSLPHCIDGNEITDVKQIEAEPHIIDGTEVFLKKLTQDFDLWIDRVPEGLTEDSLYDFFSKYGELRDCRIHSSASGSKHADVCYTSKAEVNRALAARPHFINGKLLKTKSSDKAKKATFSIFVGSLPETATEKSVIDEFSKFGKLVYWEMGNDDRLSKTGPYAVALEALNNEHVIEGTVVDVRKASEVAASMKENFG
ncbi:RNA recognition motif domain-containing protein [Ditylenchus destructor]|nr:RNA recognition motif domain-containing protein [Ditylenchus destructor]